MIAVFLALFAGLTVHLPQSVADLTLVVVDDSGKVVYKLPAPEPGEYSFDLADGAYTIRAMVRDTVLASVPDIKVPEILSIEVTFPQGGGAAEAANRPAPTGARRNQNIQVNLVDNQELTESLGRQGAQVSPITEFSAAQGNYAIELGGIGRQPQILRAARASGMRGEFYGTHNNNILNARTFFQVGDVKPSRRNQYGFRIGGPLGSDRLSFLLTLEETRESGFVNGNVLVPMPGDRTALAEDPAIRALIQSWLDAYPVEAPNRPEIDPNLLNTNALQVVHNTGGSFRMDWEADPGRRFSARYSLNDNFIDSFEFVVGQNPNQRLKPQTASLAWEEALSPQTTLRVGVNYVRANVDVLVPPGSVGQWVHFGRDFEHLGPSWDFPIHRADNSFQYLVAGATSLGRHQFDWGAEVIRTQANEFQADGSRGMMQFGNNYGRSAIDNFRHGAPSRYSIVIGELYRGFRRWDVHGYVNDRFALTPNLTVSLGLRYEFAGKPTEVNNLTEFPYDSDANNFAPRIGLAWSRARTVVRAGYGIAYGRIFPATYRVGRLNPPAVVRIDANFPDPSTADGTGPNLLEPLRGLDVSGANARSALNLLYPDLVTPYMQQYALEIEQELAGDFKVTAAYAGSRMWKLIRNTRSNRARRVDGVPTKTSTINLRRPDSRFLSVGQMRNGARAYFDAAQLRFEKVMGQGFFRGTYTFSKALDTGADFSSTAVGKDEQRAQIEALADIDLKQHSRFDAPHAFTLAYAHRLPRWLGGLTLSGSTILKDGTPFNVETGTDAPPFGNADGERSDRPSILDISILGASVDDPDTALSILRRDAFDAEAGFREGHGNLARGAFRKDGTTNFNVGVSRAFALSSDQTRTLLIRTELINAFNHPQFDSPNSNLTSPSFGQITNTLNDGRIIQVHVRFSF